MIKQWSYKLYSLFTGRPLRKMVGTTNPLIVIGDREGALKVLKIKLGGYKGVTDGGNQDREEVAQLERLFGGYHPNLSASMCGAFNHWPCCIGTTGIILAS